MICAECGHDFWQHMSAGDPDQPGRVRQCRLVSCDCEQFDAGVPEGEY